MNTHKAGAVVLDISFENWIGSSHGGGKVSVMEGMPCDRC